MKYIVETFTLFDGWANCWTVTQDGIESPETFDTIETAQAEIDDHIDGMRDSHAEAVKDGIFEPDCEFDENGEREQLRIVPLTET